MTPKVGTVYVGKPGIKPPFLSGRRLLVKAVETWGDVRRELEQSGHRPVASADIAATRASEGDPLPERRPDDELASIIVSALVRGKTQEFDLEPHDWLAEEAP